MALKTTISRVVKLKQLTSFLLHSKCNTCQMENALAYQFIRSKYTYTSNKSFPMTSLASIVDSNSLLRAWIHASNTALLWGSSESRTQLLSKTLTASGTLWPEEIAEDNTSST